MSYVCSVKRLFLSEGDNETRKKWIWIPVYYSNSENRYHRVLPDCLVKHKHYCIGTIVDAVNQDSDLDQYSFPSDSSISRWKKQAYELLRRKAEKEHSDSSDSLSYTLQNHPTCDPADYVNFSTVTHVFSTAELGALLSTLYI